MNTLEFELHELVCDFCDCVAQAKEVYDENYGWEGEDPMDNDTYRTVMTDADKFADRIIAIIKAANESPEDVTEDPFTALTRKIEWKRVKS